MKHLNRDFQNWVKNGFGEIIDNLYKGKYKSEVSKNVKNATARRLVVGIKENNRINAQRTKLNKESLENLQHDLVLPEDIIEGLKSLESSSTKLQVLQLVIKEIRKRIRLCYLYICLQIYNHVCK